MGDTFSAENQGITPSSTVNKQSVLLVLDPVLGVRARYRFPNFAKFVVSPFWTFWKPVCEIGSYVIPGNWHAISGTMSLPPIRFGRFNLASIVDANVFCGQDRFDCQTRR